MEMNLPPIMNQKNGLPVTAPLGVPIDVFSLRKSALFGKIYSP